MTIDRGARPVVTVIMPAFNSARTLPDSAQSVLDQTFDSFELIIINDGSSDTTAAVADGLAAADHRVRVIHRAHSGGPAVARNTGIDAARGRYLAFCDADDLWLPAKLDRQLALAHETGAALIYSAYYRVAADFTGDTTAFQPTDRVVRVPARLTHAQLLRSNVIGCLTAVVDVEQTGPVAMPDLPGAEDWGLWLRVLRGGAAAAGVQEPLALYRAAQPGSHSARRLGAVRAVWRVLRDEERLPAFAALSHLITDAASALRKSRI